mgnify:CR=1 FL=1
MWRAATRWLSLAMASSAARNERSEHLALIYVINLGGIRSLAGFGCRQGPELVAAGRSPPVQGDAGIAASATPGRRRTSCWTSINVTESQ